MVLPRLRPWLKSAINIQHNAKQHLTKFASRLKTFRPLRRKWSKKSWSGPFGPQTSKLREGRGSGQIKVSVKLYTWVELSQSENHNKPIIFYRVLILVRLHFFFFFFWRSGRDFTEFFFSWRGKKKNEKYLSAYFPFALLRFKIVVWFRVRFTGEIWVLVRFGSEFIKVFRITGRNKSSLFSMHSKIKGAFAQNSKQRKATRSYQNVTSLTTYERLQPVANFASGCFTSLKLNLVNGWFAYFWACYVNDHFRRFLTSVSRTV